jgi:hypothetical protein
MANYFVIGNNFKPFSYEELIKPYKDYGEAYKEQENALGELNQQANALAAALSKENDPVAWATYNKYLTDIENFKAELTDVIRNAVKLRTEVNYYPPRYEGDNEPFRVSIDGGFNDSASKSVTKVLNDLNAKFDPVPGGNRVDKDAAAEVLAALEASLS